MLGLAIHFLLYRQWLLHMNGSLLDLSLGWAHLFILILLCNHRLCIFVFCPLWIVLHFILAIHDDWMIILHWTASFLIVLLLVHCLINLFFRFGFLLRLYFILTAFVYNWSTRLIGFTRLIHMIHFLHDLPHRFGLIFQVTDAFK